MLKGYFIRKPINAEEVKTAIADAVRRHIKPVEIEAVGRIVLTLDEYLSFCDNLYLDYDFLAPYADEAVFTKDGAKCVLVGAPGQHVVAVVQEGFGYPRYVAWPFQDKYDLQALLS